jgi:hypothetical protein
MVMRDVVDETTGKKVYDDKGNKKRALSPVYETEATFDIYNDIKRKLVAKGIPEKQIAFPRDVKSDLLKKKRLFDAVNEGEVRILIGSTDDMGTGVNIQDRGVGIHNIDTEWTFEKLEQRRGRFIRQGNMMYDVSEFFGLEELQEGTRGLPVAVFNYMTEATVDAFMWDKVASKKTVTEVVLMGESETREVEDGLKAVRANHVDNQFELKNKIAQLPREKEGKEKAINRFKEGLNFFEPVNAVQIEDTIYDLKRHSKELGERLDKLLKNANTEKVHKSSIQIPIALFGHAETKEIEGEEVTTVKTAKDIRGLLPKGKTTVKTRKINKVLEWESGNDISVYIRSDFTPWGDAKPSIEDLKIGTDTQYGNFSMSGHSGFARLLATTKTSMENSIKKRQEEIEKLDEDKAAMLEELNKPFEKEEEYTEKSKELIALTAELSQILEDLRAKQALIDPDLERFKVNKSINLDDVALEEEKKQREDDTTLSIEKKNKIQTTEGQWWDINEKLGKAVADNNTAEKARLEKELVSISNKMASQNKVKKTPIKGKGKPEGSMQEVYNDLFSEAEAILGRGKVDIEVTTQAALKKRADVLAAAKRRGVPEQEIETYNVKGAYQNITVDGVAVRGVISVAADGVNSIIGMKNTVRHETFHGVFQRLLNEKDRKVVLGKYKTEEKAADAFAGYLEDKAQAIDGNVKTIFDKLIEFFERLGNLLQARGFRSAGDIFGAAAGGELINSKHIQTTYGIDDLSLSIEEGAPGEEINEAHKADKEELKKAAKSEDPRFAQYAQGLRNLVTQNPANVILDKDRTSIVDEIYAGTTNNDVKWHERMFSLPWFLAKKYNEWKLALGIEQKRDEERHMMLSEFNKKVGKVEKGEKDLHEIMQLKRSEEEAVLHAIYEGDAMNVEYTAEQLKKGIKLETLGQLDNKLAGKTVKLSDKQVGAYMAWQSSTKAMRERVIEAIRKLTYLPYQNKPWVGKLQAVVELHEQLRARTPGVELELRESDYPQRMKAEGKQEFKEAFDKILPKQIRISTLRRQMGEIKGYAPRVREGKYVVATYDMEGNTIWSDRSEKEKDTKRFIDEQIKRQTALGFKYGEDFTVTKEILDKASEFIFTQVEATSVERFVNKALRRAKTKETIDEKDINAISDEMITLLTDEFKQRGFSARMMKRRKGFPIGGYKIDNIKKRYAEYVSGGSGYITKQVAAYEYANVLRTIDINSKPDLYEDIAKYSQDMLRNQTRLDKISGRVRTAAFVWYLAGQFKSPMVNFTQNWILGIPLLEKEMGKGSKGVYHKAMYDVARKNYTEQEKKFVEEMQARGITGDQLTQEITGQTVSESGKAYESVIKMLAVPFSLSEVYNRKVSGLARFRAAIKAGDSYQQAFDKSRKFIIDVHFLYGKLNAPSGARGGTPGAAVVRTSLTFRSYTFNFLHSLKGLLSEKDFTTVAKTMTYMALLGGAASLPFLDGFLDMLERITGISWRKNAKKELEDAGGQILANVGVQGLPALLGADIGGSLRIHFPDVTRPGTLIEESVFGAFEIASPVFIERPLKAIRQAEGGLTTTRGKIVKSATGEHIKPTKVDTVATALGFRAARLARMSDNYRQFGNIKKFYTDWRGDIYTSFRLAETSEKRQSVLNEVLEYNRAATDQEGAVPLITAAQLKGALRNRIDKRFLAFGE